MCTDWSKEASKTFLVSALVRKKPTVIYYIFLLGFGQYAETTARIVCFDKQLTNITPNEKLKMKWTVNW